MIRHPLFPLPVSLRGLGALLLILALAVNLGAQDGATQRGRDIALILDVSGSMEEGWIIREVKDWIERELVRSVVQPGDRFTVLAFGTSVRTLFSSEIRSAADLDRLSTDIGKIRTRDHFTDIGSALEGLDRFIEKNADPARRPLAVFITDGKNAPPDSSPWRGRDLSLDNHFKDIGTRIAQRGWLLYVIGLIEDTDAALVAETVPGSTLAEGNDALDSESLKTHIEELDAAQALDTQSSSAQPGAGTGDEPGIEPPPVYSFDPGLEAKDTERAQPFLPIPLIAVAGGLALLALTALLIGVGSSRRRRLDDDEKSKKKPKRPAKKEKPKKKAPPSKKGGSEAAADPFADLGNLESGPVLASPEIEDPFANFDPQ